MKENQINEEKTAAASYILNFYGEVMQLTHNYANYENLMLELKNKYRGNEDNISPEEKDVIKQHCNLIRYYATKTFISYNSIVQGLKDVKLDVKIIEDFTQIKQQYIVKTDLIKSYVLAMNGFIVNTVIKNLLESSQDIVNNIYDRQENP